MLPMQAGKGTATSFVLQQLGFAPEDVCVAGDSGNDAAMFEVAGIKGILVGNAKPELVAHCEAHPCSDHYHAEGQHAAGILEGLAHHCFLGGRQPSPP